MAESKRKLKTVGTAIVGGVVLLGGIVMIPYPGPGWAVVFAGLAILATEFEWARRILKFAKKKYQVWLDWQKQQPLIVRALVLCFTLLVVVATLWLLNVYGLIASFLQLDWPLAHSPFFR